MIPPPAGVPPGGGTASELGHPLRRLLPTAVVNHLNRNDRVGAPHRAWGHVFTNHLQGAYYEFGVYRGASFRASIETHRLFAGWQQAQLRAQEPWRRAAASAYAAWRHQFYAFDTFQGLPENAEENPTFMAGHFACSLDEFRRLNRQAGIVEGPTVRYFAGMFREIGARNGRLLAELQPAAIVNLDCDLYQSARDALALVASKLLQGTVILADDWNCFAARRDQGERRAVREFLEQHPMWTFEPWFAYEFVGRAFLAHRAA